MKAHLTRRYLFSASHRLHSAEMSEEENRRVYGKCNNPYGHGHNYALEVTVAGQVDARTGMVCDLVELDDFVGREVLERFGHENLNTLALFERLCREDAAVGDLAADAYIAALALEHDCELVTLDRDFARFRELRWRTPPTV